MPPLNNSISLIQSSGSLVESSNSVFEHFLRSLVLDAPDVGLNFLFNLSHPRKALPLDKSSVKNSSKICKHNVSSCAKISSLYSLFFSCLGVMSYLFFSYEFYTDVFTVSVRMIIYPNYPALDKNFPDHIQNPPFLC